MKARPVKSGRRKFLASMLATGGAAAVVSLSPGEDSAAQSAETSQTPGPESRGYQRTAHVEAYYRSLKT